MTEFELQYMNLLPRAKYHKGEKLIIDQDYRSQVKYSYSVKVPKGSILEVVETLFPDDYTDECLVRCKNKTVCKSFDFCVPQRLLRRVTTIDRLLYG